MTTQIPSLQTIRAKKEALLGSAAKYDALAAKARSEAADYEAAERVWLKLAPAAQEGEESASAGPIARLFISHSSEAHSKPENLPPVPDMIIEALTEAANNLNVDGLTPSALLVFVRQKYWPTAKSADVGSTAWRMWREGRLRRPTEGLYALPDSKVTSPDPQLADQDS
jgi:hypothetical protein